MAVTYTFTNGTTADADEVNQNFDDVNTDLNNAVKSNSMGLKEGIASTRIPLSTTIWIRANGTAVQKTINSGGGYTTKYTSSNTFTHNYRNPMDPDYIIMWTLTGPEAAYSDDAGETWTDIDFSSLNFTIGSGSYPFGLSLTNTGRVYLAFSNGDNSNNSNLKHTDDDGSTWPDDTQTITTMGQNGDVAIVVSPVNDVIGVIWIDASDTSGYTSYKVESAWTHNNTSNIDTSGDPANTFFFYIDSDNYLVNLEWYQDSTNYKVAHCKAKWKGSVLNSSNTAGFSSNEVNNEFVNLLRFDSEEFVFNIINKDSDFTNVFRYDSDGTLYILAGLNVNAAYSNTAAANLIGVTTHLYGVSSDSSEEDLITLAGNGITDSTHDLVNIWTGF